MIRKERGGWVVKSRKGKRLSKPYRSKKAAEKRLRQIEYFKHVKSFESFLESRRQLELPFDGAGKPHHVHFMDALEDLAVKDSYRTTGDWQSGFSDGFDTVAEDPEKWVAGSNYVLWREWSYLVDEDELGELLSDDARKEAEAEGVTLEAFIRDIQDIESLVNDLGKRDFKRRLPVLMRELTGNLEWVVSESVKDTGGYVRVWRALSIDSSNPLGSTGINGPDLSGHEDFYSVVAKGFAGVGSYWAWSEDKAESYWAGGGADLSIILQALVRPEDIDWPTTIGNTLTDLDESEITVKQGGKVMLESVRFQHGNRKMSRDLDPPLVVPAGYK